MPVDGWRARHDTCRFGTYKPAAAEGWVEAACENPEVGSRYDEQFCARECSAYAARDKRPVPGRIPVCQVRSVKKE